MKNIKKLLSFLFGVLFLYSCAATEPIGNHNNSSSYQIPGCNNSSLPKTALNDSCFAYSFNDTLNIDFCVIGNCCPDSNRFVIDYEIKSDTIFVSVADTAANLCRCICSYTIHLRLDDLPKERYLFYCNYENFKYREYVSK